ncbi:MAG TPA: polysaccharide deacetylase family protein [Planctomycetaceae bacterium]|jgi:peptidoglycan/xylan/chitin deacetylase (PgdA/CDA1 family)
MPIALIFHDVVPAQEFDASGFAGAGAARYKFFEEEFRLYLAALDGVARRARPRAAESDSPTEPALPFLLTFDDGGRSAHSIVAGLLEERGWRGQFFISTDFLDTPAFLTREEVGELHRRGHVIGSHSCSHPPRMSDCTPEQLVLEWRQSCQILAEIIGEQITTASVPGGFYSRPVAAAAAQAGITVLFTSEPTAFPHVVDGCIVKGRYSIDRGVPIETMSAIAAGRFLPRWQQALAWQAKKAAKTLAGPLYADLRERWLRQSYEAHQPPGKDRPTSSEVRS